MWLKLGYTGGLCPREFLQTKGSIWPHIPCLILILIQYANNGGKCDHCPNTDNPKLEELKSWNFESMFIVHYVSYAMCHMSHVMCHVSSFICHVSPVTCFFCFLFLYKKMSLKQLDKGVELVRGGSVINGANPVLFFVCLYNIWKTIKRILVLFIIF